MSPPVERVATDPKLPESADVVVIGGGIAGVATAYFLAERGVSVVVCEKGEIAAEQSSRNWGWCRQMGRDPRELPLAVEALRLWRGLNERLGAETGFRECGLLYLEDTEAGLAKREAWLEHARPYQIGSQVLSGSEVAERLPQSARTWAGALHTPGDGRAEPSKAVPAMAEAARALGAGIQTSCAVRGIETEAGRIARVVTEKGPIRCQSVVLAGGAWSRPFCRSLGLSLPQLLTRGSVLRTAPVEGGPETNALAKTVSIRKRLDGGYTVANGMVTTAELIPASFRYFFDFLPLLMLEGRSIRPHLGKRFFDEWRMPSRWALDRPSPFEAMRVLDPEPVGWIVRAAHKNLAKEFPVFEGVKMEESWAGYIDATPDAVPVISPVEAIPGFFMATGFSGHGFGIGPGAGKLMADLVTGDDPVVDPNPYRYSRFTDGSNPRPIAGV